ncbi:hypothetical protein ACTFIZ_000406 [Dictyostelium cf. discoideum]
MNRANFGLIKLVTYIPNVGEQSKRLGALLENSIIDLCSADKSIPNDMRSFLALNSTDKWSKVINVINNINNRRIPIENCKIKAPIEPGKIICIGLNYKEHANEAKMAIPKEPIVFSKFDNAICGPNDSIIKPVESDEVDYEVELVVVIGKQAKNVSESDALQYVAGYTVGNDVSARDWQLRKNNSQWLLGKTFDTFAPIGPSIVINPEVAALSDDTYFDPNNLSIKCTLNGQVVQNSTTKEFIFNIQTVVSYLSKLFTLNPGDIIFTGTPSGVGFIRKPNPIFLKSGDVIKCEIEELGSLVNNLQNKVILLFIYYLFILFLNYQVVQVKVICIFDETTSSASEFNDVPSLCLVTEGILYHIDSTQLSSVTNLTKLTYKDDSLKLKSEFVSDNSMHNHVATINGSINPLKGVDSIDLSAQVGIRLTLLTNFSWILIDKY